MPPAASPLRIALPPSKGNRFVSSAPQLLELFLEMPLAPEFKPAVHECADYQGLVSEVLSRASEVAWAPPLLCARVERAGGTILGKFARKNLTTYRSALVCAKARPIDLAAMRDLRAIWVDESSTAGYVLPREHLRRRGIDFKHAFASESFAGSVNAALEAVASGKGDLTAIYAAPAASASQHSALNDASKAVRDQLQIVGYTDEAPNDGLVIAPGLTAATADALRARLMSAITPASAQYVLHQVFNADKLEPVAPRAYESLLHEAEAVGSS